MTRRMAECPPSHPQCWLPNTSVALSIRLAVSGKQGGLRETDHYADQGHTHCTHAADDGP